MGRPPAAIDPIHLRKLSQELSDKEIGALIGHARVTVTAARRRHGIPSFSEVTGLKRRLGDAYYGGRPREITFDEGFFAELGGEPQAYFLGLLAADGCVHQCRTKIELSLSDPDQHILDDFLCVINGSGCRIARRNLKDRKPAYRLTLCSKQMAADLITWGLTPGKTEGLELKRPIPPGLVPHFMRGLWDGDGSIGAKHFEIGIKSPLFAAQVARMIAAMGGKKPNVRLRKTRLGRDFYVIVTASSYYADFRRRLYENATFALARKKEKYQEFWC